MTLPFHLDGQGGARRRGRQQPRCCSPPAATTRSPPRAATPARTPEPARTRPSSSRRWPADPGDEGPLRGRAGTTATSKGYEVIVQDPKLDPQKQVTDLQSVIETGAAAGAWAIAIAPPSMTRPRQDRPRQGRPADPQRHARGLRPRRPRARPLVLDHRLRGPGQGDRRGARQLHQREARRQGRGDLRRDRARHRRQGGARDAPPRRRSPPPRLTPRSSPPSSSTTAPQRRPTSATRSRATRTSRPSIGHNDEGALGAIGAFKAAGKDLPCVTEAGGNDEVLAAVEAGKIYAVVALQFEADMAQSFDTLIG